MGHRPPQNKPKKPGHIALNGIEFVLQDETYKQQLQSPFNPRFSSGDQSFGDLSFFQYLAMKDWSGGEGQEIFEVDNQFFDSEGVDVTTPGELKLAPKIIRLADVNGPQKEHLDRPVEEEDAWPQIIEWLGNAVVFNDKIEYDAGGTEFLEVFDTEIIQDRVLNRDQSSTAGNITNDTSGGDSQGTSTQKTRCEILSISKSQGLPGDTIQVTARFTNLQFDFLADALGWHMPSAPRGTLQFTQGVTFRLDFGGTAERQSQNFATTEQFYNRGSQQFEFIVNGSNPGGANQTWMDSPANYRFVLARAVEVVFSIRVPQVAPGIYKLWTSANLSGAPFPAYNFAGTEIDRLFTHQDIDPNCNANVLFFVQAVDSVPVVRKTLYAPQLKSACVVGDKLVGARTYNGISYVEVYEKQNGAVDRTMQLKLSDAASEIASPTYVELIGSNGVVVAAFDNKIYKIDIETSGLTTAQRFTSIGSVPGTYVSGMALWNQRVYIASFDKSLFRSSISWTDLTSIQGSYDIDGKFWITELTNFNGALFYAGGTQDGKGEIRGYPSSSILTIQHPVFDSRIRTLNAGRFLYAGHSHATGLIAVTDRGVSRWANIDLGDEATNVVWGIEEVGPTVYMLADGGFFRTTDRFTSQGFLESSEMGSATPLIKKIWSSITVEAKTMGAGHKARLLIRSSEQPNWTLLGEMTQADGIQKVFTIPKDFELSTWIQWRIEISTSDDLTSPIIRRVLTKFVPDALQRWQWVFGIRADDNLRMLNKQHERRTGKQIVSDLKSLRSAGQLTFRDIDGEEHLVILTDMVLSPPVVNEDRLENIVMLELLEA